MNREKLINDVRNEMYVKGIRINELAFELEYSPQTLYNFLSGHKTNSRLEKRLIAYFKLKEGDYD